MAHWRPASPSDSILQSKKSRQSLGRKSYPFFIIALAFDHQIFGSQNLRAGAGPPHTNADTFYARLQLLNPDRWTVSANHRIRAIGELCTELGLNPKIETL